MLDANIVLKWYYPEKDSPKAIRLRTILLTGELTAVAPFIIFIEVANNMVGRHRISESVVSEVLDDLHAVITEVVGYSTELIKDAAMVALQTRLTVYDGMYLAIARKANIPLLTEDKALINADPRLCVNLDRIP